MDRDRKTYCMLVSMLPDFSNLAADSYTQETVLPKKSKSKTHLMFCHDMTQLQIILEHGKRSLQELTNKQDWRRNTSLQA